MSCCDNKGCGAIAEPVAAATSGAGAYVAEAVFRIQKMDCPTEEKLIRTRLQAMDGIDSMQFNLMARELTVRHQLASIAPITAALAALGMEPLTKSDSRATTPAAFDDQDHVDSHRIAPRTWMLMAVSGAAAIGAEVLAWNSGQDGSLPVVALALTAIFTGGLETLKKGWIALRNFSLNMNFLMSLAVLGAAAIGQWPEAAVVIFLFALAEMIEALSLDRARNAIQGLMAMTPDTATVQVEGGQWQAMPARTVLPGAIVRVKPGERVPLDGTVIEGRTTINQAPITGESMPVTKQPGDPVFAGTINERGAIEYSVTARQSNSTLSRIVASVQQAQGERAPTQRFVDQFAHYYIPAVVLLALLVAVGPPLLMGAAFQPWLYKALVLLVIACPCALVISTPVTVVSGLAAAARRGILIKGGVYLEQGHKLKAIALDKTGTITIGKPGVTDIALVTQGDQQALLGRAASLAGRSDHPVSSAIATYWQQHHGAEALADVANFEALTGRGIKGDIAGEAFYLGNQRLLRELGIIDPALAASLDALEREGKSAVVLCCGLAPLLIVAVADTVRPTSVEGIAQLRALGVNVVMLSGDNAHTARAVAAKVGLDDARGNLLPEDKLDAITSLISEHGYVGMVGDGINDAPALAKASIGFAMGAAGTDTALETADVALMGDDLRKIAEFIQLSAKARSVLVQNIVLALSIKAVFMGLALAGHATLWMAVFADMGASLLVIMNGLRLLRVTASNRKEHDLHS